MDEAKRGSMVGEALASLEQTQLHRGLGARAGGAFRSLVHQVASPSEPFQRGLVCDLGLSNSRSAHCFKIGEKNLECF
jgi:hypothetical protein